MLEEELPGLLEEEFVLENRQNIDRPSEEQKWSSLGENKYTRPDENDSLCSIFCEGPVHQTSVCCYS